MCWIDINDQPPQIYKEVIICSDDDKVKSAIYLGSGKWNTFLNVEFWMPFPEAPKRVVRDPGIKVESKSSVDKCEVAPKKKRGRPKKVQ